MDIFWTNIRHISLIFWNSHILRRNWTLTQTILYSIVAGTVARLVHMVLAPRIELVNSDIFTLVLGEPCRLIVIVTWMVDESICVAGSRELFRHGGIKLIIRELQILEASEANSAD